jgi:hypothetical protein
MLVLPKSKQQLSDSLEIKQKEYINAQSDYDKALSIESEFRTTYKDLVLTSNELQQKVVRHNQIAKENVIMKNGVI